MASAQTAAWQQRMARKVCWRRLQPLTLPRASHLHHRLAHFRMATRSVPAQRVRGNGVAAARKKRQRQRGGRSAACGANRVKRRSDETVAKQRAATKCGGGINGAAGMAIEQLFSRKICAPTSKMA
jgi:hypothetical protein